MQKKIFFNLLLVAGGVGLASCSSLWNNGEYEYQEAEEGEVIVDDFIVPDVSPKAEEFSLDPSEAATIYNKRIPPLNTLIVCRDKQCAPASLSKSREYIYNALAQLVDNNLDETALLCEANAQAHVCINPYLSVPAKVGVTPAYVYFDGTKIVDASLVKGKTAINLALNYNLSYNGQTPMVCKPDTSMLYVKSNNDIVLNGNGFKCDLTSVGTTTIRVMFAIDYIDLDYGYIGGYYSIGLSGPATGGGSGYGMIRLTKDAHPLSPVLKKAKSDRQPSPAKPSANYLQEAKAPGAQKPAGGYPTQPVATQAPRQPMAYQVPAVEPEPEYEGMYLK